MSFVPLSVPTLRVANAPATKARNPQSWEHSLICCQIELNASSAHFVIFTEGVFLPSYASGNYLYVDEVWIVLVAEQTTCSRVKPQQLALLVRSA